MANGVPVAAALAAGLLVMLLNLGRQQPAPIEVRPLDPIPTPTSILYVHVDGAVSAPGVYVLATGGRVFEAIDAAGGATDEADLSELNLAARVADGQKLVIPMKRSEDQATGTEPPRSSAAASGSSAAAAPPGSPTININTASQRVLESLPGIGPVTAGRIVDRRTAAGPFARIEQLREERLVTASTYERIKTLISVD